MFQNSYQNGTYFELFDPKCMQEDNAVSEDKLKTLYRTANVNGNSKVFDKELKTYVMEFTTPNSKLILPKEEKKDLYLIQQYLILQIYFHPGLSWNIELVVSDLTKTKRRIVLSPSTSKTEVKPFFVKLHCNGYKQGAWNNFIVDLYSFIEAFKGQTYRSLDAIYITGQFKLRRIYTAATIPFDVEEEVHQNSANQINFLPKHYYFPIDVPSVAKLNRYTELVANQTASTIIDYSTQNSSFLKSAKPKMSQIKINKIQELPKTQENSKTQQKNMKQFLSSTNCDPIFRQKRKEKQEQQYSPRKLKIEQPKQASKSGQKFIKKKHLIKTQQIPNRTQQSIDKLTTKKPQAEKSKVKINPWRSNKKEPPILKQNSQMLLQKSGEDRSVDTPDTVSIFKGNSNMNSKFQQTKNNHFQSKCQQYSDSQYFQLSQKFSTLTDGKFFKNELANMTRHQCQSETKQEEEEIEQNIEMQANSMESSINRRPEEVKNHEGEAIGEFIGGFREDQQKDRQEKYESLARSSLYGFGQQLMRHFMQEVERPYSPPLMEREITEEELSQNCHHDEKEEVQLIYDPVLNCYYDHRTHTYYQLKN